MKHGESMENMTEKLTKFHFLQLPKKEVRCNLILALFLSLSLFFLGFWLSKLLESPHLFPIIKEARNPQGYQFINPLLDCDNVNMDTKPNMLNLRKAISEIIEREKANKKVSLISVYYRDLNNGPWFGLNEHELFSPASLIKVPMLIIYYKMTESDQSILKKVIVNTKQKQDDQNILSEKTLAYNQPYTVEDLIYRMIEYSDNNAYELLSDNMDYQKLIDLFGYIGVDISIASKNPSGNIISVKDYASFYRILFNASYLNKEMSEKALELLSQTTYKDGLVAKLPSEAVVSHKFGERKYLETQEVQLHDCGIVYVPNYPYLICIMTRGKDFGYLEKIIQEISYTAYQNSLSNH